MSEEIASPQICCLLPVIEFAAYLPRNIPAFLLSLAFISAFSVLLFPSVFSLSLRQREATAYTG